MSARYETTERFFRPADVATLRRNQRRIQIQRAILGGSRVAAIFAVLAVGGWIWRHTQSDARFALKTIEITGAVHTSRGAVDAVTRAYVGGNLFKLDIANVQNDLGKLGWVSRIEAEKKLPDTLRIRIVERAPVALLQAGGKLQYVDESGAPFAELSPQVGDSDLPLITAGSTASCVALLRNLRARDPELYARVSEIRQVAPDAFALFDRQLGTIVYANAGDLSSKWRDLYAIARSERFDRGAIAYADLRFADRIVIKPVNAVAAPPQSDRGAINAED
jgi:cell division protein FtsQ